MSSNIIYQEGEATVVVAATESVAVATKGTAQVYQIVGYPDRPDTDTLIGTVTAGQTVFGAYSAGTTLRIEAGAGDVLYQSGVAPVVTELYASQIQAAPVAVNTTGAVSATALLGGIVTSTTAAAVSSLKA